MLPKVATIDTAQVGYELGRLRRLRGVSGETVAHALGVDKSTLSKIEGGARRVEVHEFCVVVDALGLQPGDLLPHTDGVPLRFRPLLQLLDGRSDADLQRVMRVTAAMLDIETGNQKVTETTVHPYILPSSEEETGRDELVDVRVPPASAALGVRPRPLAERASKPKTPGKAPQRRRGGAR